MPDVHISVMLADLYAALDEGRDWSLVRMGDGELRILRGDHAPFQHVENHVASDQDMKLLFSESVQAIQEADWVGWHQDSGLAHCMEVLHFVPAIYERSVYAWVNLHMGIRRSFVERVLRDSRLLLLGEPMLEWVQRILWPGGLAKSCTVYTQCRTPRTWQDALSIMRAVDESDAEVVLASLGIWALPICGHAKRAGKVAIDYGHSPDHHTMVTCEAHRERWIPGIASCPGHPQDWKPDDPLCDAHRRYLLNTCCDDSPEGTMAHYKHAGAPLCLPERG